MGPGESAIGEVVPEVSESDIIAELDPETAAAQPTARSTGAKKRRKPRQRVKRATIVVHRWISLVLGLVLLVITTSGALVVYSPEWATWANPEVYSVTRSAAPIPITQAIDTVDAAHPEFEAGGVNVYRGLYEVSSSDGDKHPGYYGLDPGTGRITGFADRDHGVMAFLNQVHECFFTCDTMPGYVSFLNASVPSLGMSWLKDMTWSGVILGIGGLMLLFLALSGVWLWYPTLKKWRHGFRVRWSKGRYARDYDLHQVIGMAAVPFLLVWGLTGANFEFSWVSTAWYATTGGQTAPEQSFTSTEIKGTQPPDIGLQAALAVAQARAAKVGVTSPPVYASSPAADDATGTYSFWFAKGFDQYVHGAYPGDYGVSIDRHNAARTHIDDLDHAPTLSNQLLDNYGAALFHYGQSFNAWWRIAWFLFGLSPLVLAVTGVSTWLAKRSVRQRRKRAVPAPLQKTLARDVEPLASGA